MTVKTGDIVTLSENAVYYHGTAMPGWVKNDKWIVKSVNGDRAIIDKNVSGTSAINSPVNTTYLTVIGQAAATAQQTSGAGEKTASKAAASQRTSAAAQSIAQGANAQSANAQSAMAVSDRGVALVAKYEGCRLAAYKCPAGIWTIGYGHTAGVKQGDTLPSEEAAKTLLKTDLAKYAASVNNCVKKGLISFSLNQNQFDALTSFCYNCGAGSLQKLVSGRNAAQIAEKILAYNKGGGKVLPGLTRRREEERALFLS